MIKLKKVSPLLLAGLALLICVTACTDDRTPPVANVQPSYVETKLLMDRVVSNGEEITADFTVRDELEDGTLTLFCFMQADPAIHMFDQIDVDNDSIKAVADSINALIFELWLQDNLTVEDSLILDSTKNANLDLIAQNQLVQDSLDTWIDDRFKVSLWLDDDLLPMYPMAVRLDSSSVAEDGSALSYLGASSIVWGQGIYLTETDELNYRAKRIDLDLNEFWVADPTWINPTKPSRDEFLNEPASYPGRYTRFELQPVRDWLETLTPGTTHQLHVVFGAPGTVTEVTASLYLVYTTAAP